MKVPVSRKMRYKIIAGFVFIVVIIVVYTARQSEEDVLFLKAQADEDIATQSLVSMEVTAEQEEEETETPKQDTHLVVDVSGEVKYPSVFTFPEGTRVYEAVEAAGGFTEKADTRNTNLATPLQDGMKLYIPNKKEVEEDQKNTGEEPGSRYINGNLSPNAAASVDEKSNLININTADVAELQKLTGVGPSTAAKIITYRQEYGRFGSTEELMNVSGIGEKTYEKLKNAITVE